MTSKLDKQSDEKFPIQIDFLRDGASGVYEILALSVSAVDADNIDVTSSLIGATSYASSAATVWMINGNSAGIYTVDILATMTSGEKLNKRLVVTVYD